MTDPPGATEANIKVTGKGHERIPAHPARPRHSAFALANLAPSVIFRFQSAIVTDVASLRRCAVAAAIFTKLLWIVLKDSKEKELRRGRKHPTTLIQLQRKLRG